jgi:predicted ATPase
MAVRPAFTITPEAAPAIAEIVARLDGLPLAIELAAAKSKLLGPEAILGRLGSRLAFLGGGARDLPARQQTLRQAIDWSYTLLPPEQRDVLPRLGVFVGGWTLDALDAVAQPSQLGLDALDTMTALADQSLVRREEAAHGEPRFMLLETIREFALEKLADGAPTGDGVPTGLDELRRRHALHYLDVAEATEPELTKSPAAGDRVAIDHDNFRAALTWAIEAGDADVGLRLGFALWRFWQQRGHLREGADWFARLLAIPGAERRTAARQRPHGCRRHRLLAERLLDGCGLVPRCRGHHPRPRRSRLAHRRALQHR